MRISAALDSIHLGRRTLLLFGTLVVGSYAAYKLAQYVINDDMTGLAYAALCVAGGVIVVAILNNWRNGVYSFLGWLLFEDFARKFLGNNMAIYFAKDFLLLVVLISFFAAFRRKEVTIFRPPFLMPLLIFIWFGGMQIFNPASTSIAYGLMGFKIFFYYVPLMFVGYALLNSEAELRRFFTINLVLVLIIVSLGIAQSIIGPSLSEPCGASRGSPPSERAVSRIRAKALPLTGQPRYSSAPAATRISSWWLGSWSWDAAVTCCCAIGKEGLSRLSLFP